MLRGVSRHQDFLWQGNALSREQHYADAALIAELGANTVRLAHYQHSEDFYNACENTALLSGRKFPLSAARAMTRKPMKMPCSRCRS